MFNISSPARTFYINDGASNSIVAFSYQATMQIDAGASITITGDDGGDGSELKHSASVSGVTSPPQPYQGQFFNVRVVRVVKR